MINLKPHQIDGVNLILNQPGCGLFFRPGTGKTLTTLVALDILRKQGKFTNTLIICPKIVAESTWQNEIEQFGFNFNVVSLINNEKNKKLSKKDRIANYQTIKNYRETIFITTKEMVVDLIQHCDYWYFPIVIIDEAHFFKDHTINRTKLLNIVRPNIQKLIELTGTPAPNGLLDLFSLLKLIDGGKRLGTTLTEYRDTFFYPDPYSRTPTGNITRWIPKDNANDQIYSLINDVCISKDTDVNLEPIIINDIPIILSENEMKQYKTLKKDKILNINDSNIIAKHAGVLWTKLRQLANGTIYNSENEYETFHTKKQEYTKYLVENANDNVVIYYTYKSDLQELKKLFPNAVHLKNDSHSKQIQKDWNDGKIKILLANPTSVGVGINIQFGGHTIIWYTVTISSGDYEQAINRLYRMGQKDTVIVHRLITKDTVDERCAYQTLQNKLDTQDDLIQSLLLEEINY